MNWVEALQALKDAKAVRRKLWYSGLILRTVAEWHSGECEHQLKFFDEESRADNLSLCVDDFEATDWEMAR
jgi:hypothetical protein